MQQLKVPGPEPYSNIKSRYRIRKGADSIKRCHITSIVFTTMSFLDWRCLNLKSNLLLFVSDIPIDDKSAFDTRS